VGILRGNNGNRVFVGLLLHHATGVAMNSIMLSCIIVAAIVLIALAINAAFLCLGCGICRVKAPGFGRAMWVIFVDVLTCVVAGASTGCIIGMLVTRSGAGDLAGLNMSIHGTVMLVCLLVTAVVYSWMIPTTLVRGLLIELVRWVMFIVLGLLITPLLPPNIRHSMVQKQIVNPADSLALQKVLDRMNVKWRIDGPAGLADLFHHLTGAKEEVAKSDGEAASLNSKWRLLETKDIGHALIKEGMPTKATPGKFVLVTYQGAARTASSRQVVYSPVLVDSLGRQFKPVNDSMSYLPEGVRFMTVERSSSGVVETFHSIYEVEADSGELHLQEQPPPEGAGNKPTP
jgi:hypothetical protein